MPTNITIKNTNQRNQIKIHIEDLREVGKEDKGKKIFVKEWFPSVTTYLKPGEQTDVWVGENRKVSVVEMPT